MIQMFQLAPVRRSATAAMAHCAPFEDYDYIIFGHDRGFIVLTDVLCLVVWLPTLFRILPCGTRLYFTSFTIPLIPLIPIRVIKTLHTLLDPSNVEQSFIYCWYLRLEYPLHYFLSNVFLSSTDLYLFLVLKRRSTVFPEEFIHRVLFSVLVIEAFLRAVIAEFLDGFLEFWPSIYHTWLQILLTILLPICLILLPCFARKVPKEGKGGWSIGWIYAYILIPFLLHLYQFLMSSVILLARHGVTGYEATIEEQEMFWFSIESYISHKFAFTPMGIMAPLILLPPVRASIKGFFKRQDAVQPT